MILSKELIAAYADGELEGDELQEVAAAVAADPSLQAEVDAHRALRARLSAHFAPIAQQPVPEALSALLQNGTGQTNVVTFPGAARGRGIATAKVVRWRRLAGPALAASLVLVVVGLGFKRDARAGYADGELAAALDRQLVETQSPDAPVRILLTFRDNAGRFCRGFSSPSATGIACHDSAGWKLGKLISGSSQTTGEYRQASTADADILAEIQDLAEGPALDGQAEREAVRRNWRH